MNYPINFRKGEHSIIVVVVSLFSLCILAIFTVYSMKNSYENIDCASAEICVSCAVDLSSSSKKSLVTFFLFANWNCRGEVLN